MLAIATYATKSYFFAWRQFIKKINAAASYKENVHFILATDKSSEAKDAFEYAKNNLPEGWDLTCINLNVDESNYQKYKENSQLLIASLQEAAFNFAKKIRATMLWSVESDTLVPPDALRMSEWALNMPQADGSNYYDVAACTYPNGLFLGGFGSPKSHINEDFLIKEKKVPERFQNLFDKCELKIKSLSEEINKQSKENIPDKSIIESLEKEHKRLGRLIDKSKQYPPDGNIWELIAKYGWRRRGWLDFAYPGIGKGALVPSDWCGFGCTLMSKKALSLINFDGYEGKGTQDLFVCWNKWYPAGVKIACIAHSPCDHVKLNDKKNLKDDDKNNSKYLHYRSFHELDGEFKDHLRVKVQPWIPI